MAESTLRENRRGATQQNATAVNQARMRVLVQEPFYQHDHLGPGAPLREITSASDGDGYYDWAGRRLFLADGEPDPMCPGAYRYQHNPDCCDLEAPDSDPRSPRYEPMHLRHKPGDTWIIDTNRPYDPYDPGPFGSPGWYKDERTGRHRRDETPDPLPAEGWIPPTNAWFPGTADWPEPEASQAEAEGRGDRPRDGEGHRRRDDDRPRTSDGHDHGRGDRPRVSIDRSGVDAGRERPRAASGRGGADRPPPWGPRGLPVPSEPDEPVEPEPRRARSPRPRFWSGEGADPQAHQRDRYPTVGDRGWTSGACDTPTGHPDPDRDRDRGDSRARGGERSRGAYRSDDGQPDALEAQRFSKLREAAFDRFLINFAELRAAHFAPEKPYLRERAWWVLRWLAWVLALGLVAMPAPLTTRNREPAALQPIPAQRTDPTDRADHLASREATRPEPEPVRLAPVPTSRIPGVAIAAAIGGARAARKLIADRENRTRADLANAVRNSATSAARAMTANGSSSIRTDRANLTEPAAAHWHTRPRQNRPRPSPSPTGTYMTMWEQAFDTGHTLILGTTNAIGGAA